MDAIEIKGFKSISECTNTICFLLTRRKLAYFHVFFVCKKRRIVRNNSNSFINIKTTNKKFILIHASIRLQNSAVNDVLRDLNSSTKGPCNS